MDADRKNVTWEHLYRHMYTEDSWSFWGLLDFNKRKAGKIGWKSEIKWNEENKIFKEIISKYPYFEISGDADFGTKGIVYNTYIEMQKRKCTCFLIFL